MLQPFPGSLSMGVRKFIVEMTKKKIVPVTMRPRTQGFQGRPRREHNHRLRSSRDTPFQCKFHQESLVSIFMYGFRPEKLPGLSRNESLTKRIYV